MERISLRARAALAVAGMLALGAAARFHAIGEKSYWFDEGVTLGMVRLPFAELLRHAWDPYLNNQVLYYLALRPWHVLGESEAALRAFSAVFSIATVAVAWALGRRLFGAAAGVIAGAVVALHPWLVRYAQEARAYSLATFLVALSALFLARHVETRARRDLVLWVVAGGLALYAHFFAGLAVAAQVASLAALGPRELRDRKPLLLGALALAALELPIAVFLVVVPKGLVGWIPPVSLSTLADVGSALAGGSAPLLLFFLAALVATAILGARRRLAAERWAAALTLSWALVPTLAMAAVSLRQPILLDRYVLASAPAFALAAGAALGPLAGRGRAGAAVAAALVALVALADLGVLRSEVYVEAHEDWRLVAEEVAEATRPGDAIVYDSPWGGLTLGYYLERAARRPERLQAGPLLFGGAYDLGQAEARERVWMVLSRDDGAGVLALLSRLRPTHPVVSGRAYAGGLIKVLLVDVAPRRHGEGAFGY